MKIFFIIISLFAPIICYATADSLCVNHITKELYLFEIENDYFGINWQPLGSGDDKLKQLEAYYLANGYKYAKFPYKIELFCIIIIALIIVSVIFIIRYRNNKYG